MCLKFFASLLRMLQLKRCLFVCAIAVCVFILLAQTKLRPNWLQANQPNSRQIEDTERNNTLLYETIELSRKQLREAAGKIPTNPVATPQSIKSHAYFTKPRKKNCTVFGEVLLEPHHDAKEDGVGLLVLVPSVGWEPDIRRTIRETWGSVSRNVVWPGGKELSMKVEVVYVLGLRGQGQNNNQGPSKTSNISKSVDAKMNDFVDKIAVDKIKPWIKNRNDSLYINSIIQEQSTNNDILLLNMIDSYRNLTRKMLLCLKWASETYPKVKYILKADQDVFVHMPLLTAYLKSFGTTNSIYGFVQPRGAIYRSGKWGLTQEELPLPHYPPYAAGNGYVISKDAVNKILKASCLFPHFHIEDTYITGVLATSANVQHVNIRVFNNRIDKQPVFCEFVRDRQFLGNGFNEQSLRSLWTVYGNVTKHCPTS